MFQRLVRRISTSFYPRPDRPWNDDATSTAPSIQIGSKRRLADSDDEDDYSQSVSMPPPSSLPGTPTTPGYGSVTKKQRVGMDVDGEELTQAKAGEVSAEAVQAGEEKVEEGVKEVTEGVREVEITSQATEAHPTKSETETASNDIVEVVPPAADAAKSEEPAKEAVPSTESIEEATAAAVPLPESPDLRAQVEAPALEPGEISTELSTGEAAKSADGTAEKVDAPADKKVPSSIQPAENVQEAKEEKADGVPQATTDPTP